MTFFLLIALSVPAVSQTVAGRAKIVDGDTLDVSGTRIRLHGIDAPERDQTCGRSGGGRWKCGHWATGVLKELTQGREVECKGIEADRYGRLVAMCRVGTADIGAEMVERGAAQAYRKYSMDYVGSEKRAYVAAVGIWQGETVHPETFRKSGTPEPARADGCLIKGNISKSGRIYHQPGQKHYSKTRISEAKGERWFCSEEDARAAGWRRARQ